jgi:iron complex outermembrane recepter protein
MVTKRVWAAAGLGAISMTAIAVDGYAQGAEVSELAEVVVTAQRREQRLQDVPVAVSVVSGVDLERENIKFLQDVASQLANVKITTGTLTNPIYIRGIGSGNNSGFEQSVATFADGVYRPRSRSTNAALMDLERVEVLKGPQTTFFGANAIAGALNITTRKPGKEFSSNVSALYAVDDGEYNLEGGVTLPASDTLSFRIAARFSGMDGFMRLRDGRVKGPNDESQQGRVAVRWEPSDSFRSDLRFDVGKSRTDEAVPLETLNCAPGAPYPAPLPPPAGRPPTNCALALLTNPNLEDDLDFHSNSPPSWYAYDFYEGALTNSWDFGAGSLNSITAYFHQEANNRTQLVPLSFPTFTVGGFDPIPSEVREKYHQASQELRFQSDTGGRFEYMFGAYYAQSRWRNSSGTGFFFIPFGAILSGPPFNGPPFNIVTNPTQAYTGVPLIRTSDKTYSGFASATINATDQFRINLGARYSRITKEGLRSLTFGTSVNNEFGTFVPFPTAANQIGACVILTCDNRPFTPARIVDSDFMPSASLQYDFTDDVMGYVSYSSGFKAGGFSGAATANTFGPETVDAYEVGIKGVYLDRRLTLNADVFRMEYKGLQETAYTQTLASIVLNAAESVSQGVELNANWRMTEHVLFRTDLAYLDSKYRNFRNAPCTSLGILTATCGTPTTGAQDMSGKTRGYSPQWSGSVGMTFQYALGEHQLRIDPSIYFTSGFFMNAAADPLLRQNGFSKYDLRIGYGPEDNRWEVAMVGKNLSDKETIGVMLEMPGSLGTVSGFPERGRAIALQFSLRN